MSTNHTQPASDFEREGRRFPPEAYQRAHKVDGAFDVLASSITELGWMEAPASTPNYPDTSLQEQADNQPIVEVASLNPDQLAAYARRQAQPAANPLFRDAA